MTCVTHINTYHIHIIYIYMYIYIYLIYVSYKSYKKYSQHHSVICKLQSIVFCHFGLCSAWDKGPSCHSGSQQHFGVLLCVLEVAAAWCSVAGGSPGPWRGAALGHTAEMSPCLMRQEVHSAVSCDQGSPKVGL